jgi:hypothetical protein
MLVVKLRIKYLHYRSIKLLFFISNVHLKKYCDKEKLHILHSDSTHGIQIVKDLGKHLTFLKFLWPDSDRRGP